MVSSSAANRHAGAVDRVGGRLFVEFELELVEAAADERDQHAVAIGELVVERRHSDAGAVGEFAHGQPVEAVDGDDLADGMQDLRSRALLPRLPSLTHRGCEPTTSAELGERSAGGFDSTVLAWSDRLMTRLGYQIPNFTYPGVGPADLFDAVAYQAKEADTSGFDTVLVMDHFYQLPMLGEPDQFMLECYSLLSALARETKNVRLSALVTGNTYRNPAVLAKTVTTLDIVSEGRAQLGIGAGWFELEHEAFGIEFGTFTDRFEKLEEALQIIIPMLRGERPTARRPALHGQGRDQRATAGWPDPGDDRRRRREEDVADGRPVRRRVEPDLPASRPATQTRRARRPLRAARPRSLGDHGVVAEDRLYRADHQGGDVGSRCVLPAPWARPGIDVRGRAGGVARQLHLGRPRHRRPSSSPLSSSPASTASRSTCRPTATSKVASNSSARRSPP